MTSHRLPLTVCALWLMGASAFAQSQTPALLPALGASAPSASSAPPPVPSPGPRLLTPEEKRDATAPRPDDTRPEGTVTPQISVPLGTPRAAPSAPPLRPPQGEAPAPTGGVDDDMARCSALTDKNARARCRSGLPRDLPQR